MANYWNINTKIWKDPDFQDLSDDGKLVFLHVLTNETRTLSGIYPITIKTIGDETGIGRDRATKAIEELSQAGDSGMIRYDHANRVIWVVNAVKYIVNIENSPAKLKNVARNLKAVGDSPLVSAFLEKYGHLDIPYPKQTNGGRSIDPPQTDHRPTIDQPGENETENEMEMETEIEIETETENETRARAKQSASAADEINFVFDDDLDQVAGEAYRLFEREFGRPLSPIEGEEISRLVSDYGLDLVREALRRAVVQGVRNLKYTTSILKKWRDAGLKTIIEVLDYEQAIEEKKAQRQGTQPVNPSAEAAKVIGLESRRRQETIAAACSYIRVTLGDKPSRVKAEEIAQGYGPELVPDILQQLYGGEPP